MLQRFIFAIFSKGPPATNRESPRERGGERGLSSAFSLSSLFLRARPRALPFPSSDFSEKHSSQTRGEKKCEVFTLLFTPGSQRQFKEGDAAAVGCMVDSCRTCASCQAGHEQFWRAFPHPYL
jgi:hypothetical protein